LIDSDQDVKGKPRPCSVLFPLLNYLGSVLCHYTDLSFCAIGRTSEVSD